MPIQTKGRQMVGFDKHSHVRRLVLQLRLGDPSCLECYYSLARQACCPVSPSTPHCMQMLVPSDLQTGLWRWRWLALSRPSSASKRD